MSTRSSTASMSPSVKNARDGTTGAFLSKINLRGRSAVFVPFLAGLACSRGRAHAGGDFKRRQSIGLALDDGQRAPIIDESRAAAHGAQHVDA